RPSLRPPVPPRPRRRRFLDDRGPLLSCVPSPRVPGRAPVRALRSPARSSSRAPDPLRRRDRRRGSPGFSREIGLTRARILASPPNRPNSPPRGRATTSYSTSFSSTPSSSRAASSASSIVRPVVSTHSIYRFRFFLLLLRRRRDWLLRADPPCRAAGCLDAGCFVGAGFAADPPPEFPSAGGRNKSRNAASGLDRVPVGAVSLAPGGVLRWLCRDWRKPVRKTAPTRR